MGSLLRKMPGVLETKRGDVSLSCYEVLGLVCYEVRRGGRTAVRLATDAVVMNARVTHVIVFGLASPLAATETG